MIDLLLGKVTGFFEKDFLFASFLPALLFVACLTTTLAVTIGIEGTWALIESWSLVQQVSLMAIGILSLVAFAYLLNAMRTGFAGLWSGRYHLLVLWGFLRLGEIWHRRRFHRLRAQAQQSSPWRRVSEWFSNKVRQTKYSGRKELDSLTHEHLKECIHNLTQNMSPNQVQENLQDIINAYKTYIEDDLIEIHEEVKWLLEDWHYETESRFQTFTYQLDRNFGGIDGIRATKLGNIIESYNQYSYKRYKIEGEVFWPRLRAVISPEYMAQIQEPQIMLDFSLTIATLSAIYGLLALLAGPWLWVNPWFWLSLTVVAFIASFLFYRLSVSAAYQLGEIIRASFDLFRLNLLETLRLPPPTSYLAEQEHWEKLSKLVVYGVMGSDFPLQTNLAPNEQDH